MGSLKAVAVHGLEGYAMAAQGGRFVEGGVLATGGGAMQYDAARQLRLRVHSAGNRDGFTDDACIARLGSMPNLRKLFLEGAPISDEAIGTIQKFRQLDTLSVASTALYGKRFSELAGHPCLKALYLDETFIDDQALEALCPLRLQYLSVQDLPRVKGAWKRKVKDLTDPKGCDIEE